MNLTNLSRSNSVEMNKSRVRNFIKDAAGTSILDSKEDFEDEYFKQESRVRSNTTLATN